MINMLKNVLVFGASNNRNSIDKQFAISVSKKLRGVKPVVVDLNDFELPVYSVDLEKENGIHENALAFHKLIRECDALVISLAEHNGLHTSAFKNLWDWLSRIPSEKPMDIWGGKPMFLLSTSPSKRPHNYVLKVSKELFPHFGANIVADFYLPSFNHFLAADEITQPQYQKKFKIELEKFQSHLTSNLNP